MQPSDSSTNTNSIAKPKKIRRSQQEWQSIIQAFEQSGMSCQAFCLANDIAESTFYKWQAKLNISLASHAQDQISQTPPGMSDFIAISTHTSPQAEAIPDWAIEVLIGDVTLRIR